EHCWEYGFILRYPSDKSEMTGITYEPWHYRYVGVEDAQKITAQGVCLEEYLGRTE
ncbi:MAG TPA: D-alanyl-D-alanine carboxypeptidase, partial [Ruthenibacterium lactatiformans]|nr:D-alanyl-D-alanine carboxypeptidase [Ruthenibacterium lactatiformans]